MPIVTPAGQDEAQDEALDQWCVRWLGSPVSEMLFEAGSLSAVVGVRLADGSEVVVKVRRSAPRLQAAYAVHRHVWRSGYPVPEPLVPPTPWAAAESASAERLVGGGEVGGRSPGDAARSADALAALIAITATAGDVGDLSPSPSWVAWDHDGPGLWPCPDAGQLDLDVTAGPAWLDEAAARCRERLRRYRAPRVIGHADWHADNVRWSGDRLLVVHDWDSVVRQPEAVIAGIAAAVFPATGDSWQPASVDESEQFLTAYIRATPRAWTPEDSEAFWAASVWTLAVDAKEAVAGGSHPTLTEAEALERLSLAGA
jgi:Ser/Thr protein kinase RdoA (MazF antagonist)